MNVKSLLESASGGSPAEALAQSFGVDPAQADRAVAVMAQSLANRIERNTLSRGGLADVVDLLARPGAGAALQEPQALASPQVEAIGNSVLDVLIGSKHVSRGIAQSAARASGIDEATLRKMLPAVASMVIGSLQAKAMPQIEKSLQPLKISASPLPLPGDVPARGPGAPSRHGGPGRTGSPLPIPGDDIPGINVDGPSRYPRLPDIVRRGGGEIPGGGSLDSIIRDILANGLGFKNGGIIAFILKIIFSRWFLGLLSRILFRR